MKVRLTADALADLAHIKQAAEDYDVGAAALVLAAITRAIRSLKAWPHLGHVGHWAGTREFLVRRLPFVIVYQLDIGDDDELVVLRVYHVRQQR